MVRSWHSNITKNRSADAAAKSYRLLGAIMNAGVAEELITRNPCKVDGGDRETPLSDRSPQWPRYKR